MDKLTSKENLKEALKWAEKEIVDLRQKNTLLNARLAMADRILSALECHRSKPSEIERGDDRYGLLSETIRLLETESNNTH